MISNFPRTAAAHRACLSAVSFGLLLAASCAQAAVTVQSHYRLGDDDPGATAGQAVTQTRDAVGTRHLEAHFAPVYHGAVSRPAQLQGSALGVQFEKSNNYARNNDFSIATDNVGIELWVKPTSLSFNDNYITVGQGVTDGWSLGRTNGQFRAAFATGNSLVQIGAGPAQLNRWTHLALVRAGGVATFYVDGVASGSSAFTPIAPQSILHLGGDAVLDEVRTFSFAPGQFQITDLLIPLGEIGVEQPAGTALASGASVDFGFVGDGDPPAARTFVVANSGIETLQGPLLSISGQDAAQFGIVAAPASSLAAGATTSFTVQYSPDARGGARNAVLHIESDDADEGDFQILLTGTADGPPLAVTLASGSGATAAEQIFFAAVNPGGLATAVHFEYGADTSYGTDSTTLNLPAGDALQRIVLPVAGLVAGATYHYRVVATSAAGTVVGGDSRFTVRDDALTVQRWYRLGETDLDAVTGTPPLTSYDNIGGEALVTHDAPSYTTAVGLAAGDGGSLRALDFSGGLPTADSAALALVDNFGVELFVRPSGTGGTLIYNGNGGANGWGLVQQGNAVAALFGGVEFFGTTALTPGEWTHVALVRDSGATTLYVGGQVAATTASAPNAASPIGDRFQLAGAVLDEVRVFTFAAGSFDIDDLLLPRSQIEIEQPAATPLPEGQLRDFGSAAAPLLPSDLQFTVRNTGSDPLTAVSLALDGANAADFSVLAAPAAIVAPAASTTFTVRFAPTATGTRNATLRVTSNAPNGSFDIPLTGFGVSAPQAITGRANVEGGTSQQARVAGIANAGGLSTQVWIQYGTSIVYDQATPPVVLPAGNLDGQDLSFALAGLSPGTTYHYRLYVENALGNDVGEDRTFTTRNDALTVAAHFRFGEDDPGAAVGAGASSFVDSAGGAPLLVFTAPPYLDEVAATAAAAGSSLATSLHNTSTFRNAQGVNVSSNFGHEFWVRVDDNAPGDHLLMSNGDGVQNGWVFWKSTSQFRVGLGGTGALFFGGAPAIPGKWTHLALVNDNGVTTFYVDGVPSGTSTETVIGPSAALNITSEDYDEARFFTFAPGTFDPDDLLFPQAHLVVEQPATVPVADGGARDFGAVDVDSSADLVFSVSNDSDDLAVGVTLDLDGAFAAQFSVITPPAASIPPHGSTSFTVRFSPTFAGAHTAALHLRSNDPDAPSYDVALTATGVREPTALTLPANSGASLDDGVLHAFIDSGGLPTQVRFEYGTSTDYGQLTPVIVLPGARDPQPVRVVLSGLAHETTHHVRVLASSDRGSDVGDDVSFRTRNDALTVQHYYRSGEIDAARVLALPTAQTRDAVGEAHLQIAAGTGPGYSSDVAASASADTGSVHALQLSQSRARGPVTQTAIDNFGIEAWIRPGAQSGNEVIAYNGHPGFNGWGLLREGGQLKALYGGVALWGSMSLPADRWSHVALVRQHGLSTLYLDAQAIATFAGNPNTPNGSFALVSDPVNGTSNFIGNLDEVRVFTFEPGGFSPDDLIAKLPDVSLMVSNHVLADGETHGFGDEYILGGATNHSFTVSNHGNVPLSGIAASIAAGPDAAEFSVTTPPPATLAPGASATFNVRFAPTVVGEAQATLLLASNDPDEQPFEVVLSGQGVDPEIEIEQPVGDAVIDGGEREFPATVVGDGSTLTFSVHNPGSGHLIGLAITFHGLQADQFSVVTPPAAPVVPGGSTTFQVRFAPTTIGNKLAILRLASNDRNEGTYDILLSGMGTLPDLAVEQPVGTPLSDGDAVSFGTADGLPVDRAFVLRNTGIGELSGLAFAIDGADASRFSLIDAATDALPAGGSRQFTVRFTPAGAGTSNASLRIASNDPDEAPFDIDLSADSLVPEIGVQQPVGVDIADGGSRGFGAHAQGTTADLAFTLRNTGAGTLRDLQFAIDGANAGEFAITAPPSATLAAGASAGFTLHFTPSGNGPRSAMLHIASNDADEASFDIALSGNASVADIALTVEGFDFVSGNTYQTQSLLLGESRIFEFTLSNAGGETLGGLQATVIDQGPTVFSIDSLPPATLAPGASAPLGLRFTPTAEGFVNATLQIASDDPDESPFVVQLLGHAVPGADLQVSVSNQVSYLHPGEDTVYTIQVLNAGPSAVDQVMVEQFLGVALFNVQWDCQSQPAGLCPAAVGVNAIQHLLATPMPPQALIEYTMFAQHNAPLGASLLNQVAVYSNGQVGDPAPENNLARDDDRVLLDRIFVSGFEGTGPSLLRPSIAE